jgi:hypothetical protein
MTATGDPPSVSTYEPFGNPDGAMGDLDHLERGFVRLPSHYGGVGRSTADPKVRVVVGRLGAGKSLYLRLMQNMMEANPAVFSQRPVHNAGELTSHDVAQFTIRAAQRDGVTEAWKVLWRRAIFRAAYSLVVTEPTLRHGVGDDLVDELAGFAHLLGAPRRRRRVVYEAKQILLEHPSAREVHEYLHHPHWSDAEDAVTDALASTKPMFLYVDAIDDHFQEAPRYWLACQRGLHRAVMDLLRDSAAANRLHVVIALRDIVLAATRSGEHGLRLSDVTHTNVLAWDRASIAELLRHKVSRLDDHHFTDPTTKTVASWLGMATIHSRRPRSQPEPIEAYLVRHTRQVPRDVVMMGNALAAYLDHCRARDMPVTEEGLRREVSRAAQSFARNQLVQCATHVLSELMPSNAVSHGYASTYLDPNDFQINAVVDDLRELIVAVGTETFGPAEHETMTQLAAERLGEPVDVGTILWQNVLVGAIDHRGEAAYYNLDDHTPTSLPRAPRYVFNPILFDVLPQLRATLDEPIFP